MFSLLFVRILNRIAHARKFSYTQTYSISLQKATKNINFPLNPDTHDAPLKITYHDFSIHFFGIPKNINFCKNRIRYPYTSPSRKPAKKMLSFLQRSGGRDSLPRVLRAGETGLQTLNIARCCCQASSLEGLRESQRNVEGHVLSNNRRKEIEGRTGEREVEQRKGLRRSISIISSFSIDDMSLVAPEVKQLSIRSQSKALVSMRYQSSIFL